MKKAYFVNVEKVRINYLFNLILCRNNPVDFRNSQLKMKLKIT